MMNGEMAHVDNSNAVQSAALPQLPSRNYFADVPTSDHSWVTNPPGKYRQILRQLPQIFAWEEPKGAFRALQLARQSITTRRLRSSFHHIALYDAELAQSMEETFDALPAAGRLRFMNAPETFWYINTLRSEPALSVMQLSNYLNAEAVKYGLGAPRPGYYTALGDLYYADGDAIVHADHEEGPDGLRVFKAPYLADTLPLDFYSPNVQHAKDTSGPPEYVAKAKYEDFTVEEISAIVAKVQDAFDRIEKTSVSAATLIREFIKVIIPLKWGSNDGSTSQPRFPGRVLLTGIELSSPARIASSLVHEAMHQLLYILEWSGEFVIPALAPEEPPLVKSLWTNRGLSLHSFIHACFIWYGLARFFALPEATKVFEPRDLQHQLTRSISGFKGSNPIDELGSLAGRLRYDVVTTATSLQGYLEPILMVDGQAQAIASTV
jgi:hypothetical protein